MKVAWPAPIARLPNNEHVRFLEPQTRESVPWLLAAFSLIVTILPSYIISPIPFHSIATPARVIGLVFFVLVIFAFVLRRRSSPWPSLNPPVIILLVYLLITTAEWGIGVSNLRTAAQEEARGILIIAWCAPVGLALYTVNRVVSAKQRSIVLGCLVVGITFSGVVGLIQHISRVDLADLLQPPGFRSYQADINNAVGLTSPLAERGGAVRAYGTFVHPIPFSVLCASAVPAALHFARYAASRKIRLLASIATVVLLLAVPSGVARSGLVALIVACLVYARTLNFRQLCNAGLTFAALFIAYAAFFPVTADALFQSVVNSGDDPSVLVRIGAQYDSMVSIFKAHPIFGIGLGSVTSADYGVVDNLWLVTMAEGGLLGLAALAALAVGGVLGVTAALRRSPNARQRDQVHAMAAMFMAILVNSTTFQLFGFEQAMFVFFLSFALIWSNCNEQPDFTIPNRPLVR